MTRTIAIDGPVGAGKSTVAGDVARTLGILHLDTGAMYRALGLKMLRMGEDLEDEVAAGHACAHSSVQVVFEAGVQKTLLDGEDVTGLIRAPEVGNAASTVSKWQDVRRRMVELQREIAQSIDMVLDGRDIGTCVLPNATLKIFLTAQPEVRARRRYEELRAKGIDAAFEQVLADLQARDAQDENRAVDPLRKAEDAVLVDTSRMTQLEAVDHIVALYRRIVSQEVAQHGREGE